MHQNDPDDTVKVLRDIAAAIKMIPERNLRAFLFPPIRILLQNRPACQKQQKNFPGPYTIPESFMLYSYFGLV
jgi:hypothetical protein